MAAVIKFVLVGSDSIITDYTAKVASNPANLGKKIIAYDILAVKRCWKWRASSLTNSVRTTSSAG